jgi:hypothetical protein
MELSCTQRRRKRERESTSCSRLFAFHQPETLGEWAAEGGTMCARLRQMPPLITIDLAVKAVEANHAISY